MAEQKHSARLGKTFLVGCLVGGWLGRGERLRIRLKLSTAQILQLQPSARVGKTFPSGWLDGWGKAGEKAGAGNWLSLATI